MELWLAHISGAHLQQGESSKLRFYKQVKESFEMEPYLKVIPIFHIQKVITKFRCSDHILEIEKTLVLIIILFVSFYSIFAIKTCSSSLSSALDVIILTGITI